MLLSLNIKAYLLKKITNKKPVDFDLKDSKNVLFMRYDRIGDMLISTPVYRALKNNFPEINIIVLASRTNKDILSQNPYVDSVIINHKNNFFRDIISLIKLRKLRIDACIEFDHSVIPHAIMRLRIMNPKIVISVNKQGRYGVSGNELIMYDFFTDKPDHWHFRNIWLNTLNPFGINSTSLEYDLFISEYQERLALNFLKEFESKCKIGINLEGAVVGKKINSYELKKICEGIKKIHKDIQVIILTTPENLMKITNMINKMSLNYVAPSYKTNKIQDLAAIIKNLDLIISPDTSVIHIASAFNKPVVSIHENNIDSYELFSPVSKLHRTVFSPSNKGISGFSVAKVIEYSSDLLSKVS